jgi:hypothetical protein
MEARLIVEQSEIRLDLRFWLPGASGDTSIRPMRVTQNPANEAGPDWHSRRQFQSL